MIIDDILIKNIVKLTFSSWWCCRCCCSFPARLCLLSRLYLLVLLRLLQAQGEKQYQKWEKYILLSQIHVNLLKVKKYCLQTNLFIYHLCICIYNIVIDFVDQIKYSGWKLLLSQLLLPRDWQQGRYCGSGVIWWEGWLGESDLWIPTSPTTATTKLSTRNFISATRSISPKERLSPQKHSSNQLTQERSVPYPPCISSFSRSSTRISRIAPEDRACTPGIPTITTRIPTNPNTARLPH